MDTKFESSCKILDIEYTCLSELTKKYIKKKFHYMALRYHPDKIGNTIESTKKFQEIREAYDYLILIVQNSNETNEPNETSGSNKSNESNDYIILLSSFISNMINSNFHEDWFIVIKKIINGCKDVTMKMFEELDKEICIDIYYFICKNKELLHISDTIISQVKSILIEKFKNDKIYILNPTIDDLFDNNIYKLFVENDMYLVPLWHNEIYFDSVKQNGEIIIYCVPVIDNIVIDENNHLYLELKVEFKDLLTEEFIIFMLGKRVFKIPVKELFIKTRQNYIFKQQGISQIMENDIYNTENKSDIIVKVIFH